eukprot:SAG31_NODE_497_length_14862_cov_6.951568_14_plen_100_part_00
MPEVAANLEQHVWVPLRSAHHVCRHVEPREPPTRRPAPAAGASRFALLRSAGRGCAAHESPPHQSQRGAQWEPISVQLMGRLLRRRWSAGFRGSERGAS